MDVRADRFPLADGLRALAALAVLGTHAFLLAGAIDSGSAVARYTMRLEVGVTVFFVLSGFLLYRPFFRARLDGVPAPATGPYAWRRFLRIVPAYWVALALSALWLGTAGVLAFPDGLRFFGFGQTYSQSTISGGLNQAWSLCVEVAFYAFLPLWAWIVRRAGGTGPGVVRSELLGLAVLFVAAVGWKAAALRAGDPDEVVVTPSLLALPAFFDVFALGMGLAVLTVLLERDRARGAVVRWVERHGTACWLLALVLFWVVSTRIGIGDRLFEPMTNEQYAARHLLYAGIAVALVVPAVVGTGGLARRLLATPVMAWLGLVSYGIFLWSFTVLGLLDRLGIREQELVHPYIAWVGLGFLGAVVLAAISLYAVERPALSLKRRFPDPAAQRGGEATAESAPAVPPAASHAG